MACVIVVGHIASLPASWTGIHRMKWTYTKTAVRRIKMSAQRCHSVSSINRGGGHWPEYPVWGRRPRQPGTCRPPALTALAPSHRSGAEATRKAAASASWPPADGKSLRSGKPIPFLLLPTTLTGRRPQQVFVRCLSGKLCVPPHRRNLGTKLLGNGVTDP